MWRDELKKAIDWFQQKTITESAKEICTSRDVFQGRLGHMLKELALTVKQENESALFTAILGEMGNNCFDHNLGQWRDVSGCWFHYGLEEDKIWGIVADRGQGVCASLKRVVPTLKSDDEALEVAFYKRMSGRSPEKRGNGLKFVRSVINGNEKRGLFFASGDACRIFGGLKGDLEAAFTTKLTGKGAFAFVLFKHLS